MSSQNRCTIHGTDYSISLTGSKMNPQEIAITQSDGANMRWFNSSSELKDWLKRG